MKQITAVIIGAGSRGNAYTSYAERFPRELKIVGVAEPDRNRREYMAEKHRIPGNSVFEHWKELLDLPRMADAAFICTQDTMHVEPAVQAMRQGYDVLLEKPVAPDKEGCLQLYREYNKHNSAVAVAHVLRYTPFFMALKELIDEGAIGGIRGIQHNENVGHLHYSHSYVRGNWRRRDESSPMILAKSCHDMDILLYLTGMDCLRLSSFGARTVFTGKKQPEGAPDRCLDGCPHRSGCPYYAPKIYLDGKTEWPVNVLTTDLTPEGITKALQNGPYGRCVYACDNDVVEHQTVNLEFDGNIPAVFTMSAFTGETYRTIKILGDKGELRGHMEKKEIEIFDFSSRRTQRIQLDGQGEGHGGGDTGIIRDFLIHLNDRSQPLSSSLERSIQSHMMAFAAEESRNNGITISMKDYSGK